MTLPTPDAQSPGFLSQSPHSTPLVRSTPHTHSMPNTPPHTVFPSGPLTPAPSMSATEFSDKIAHERAVDLAARSQDLATGGLKTLTAKRELPPRLERRVSEALPDVVAAPHSYAFILVIIACILVMLISGGIVLFMILQP